MNINSLVLFRGEAMFGIKVSCQKRKAKGAGRSRVRMAPAMFSSFPVQRGAPNGRQAHPQVGLDQAGRWPTWELTITDSDGVVVQHQ